VPARARLLLDTGPEGPGVRKAVIVTLGAAGVMVLERAGATWGSPVATPRGEAREDALDRTAAGAEAGARAGSRASSGSAAANPESDGVRIWEVPGERVSTVDSTGAGDAFNGALAAALAEGRPLAEAVQRAVAGGALATTHVGAREGMPTAVELEEFLAAR
jgi:sugar/nucleoside kinase (ribokinase family)